MRLARASSCTRVANRPASTRTPSPSVPLACFESCNTWGSTWVRAGRSGILLSEANTGDWVEKGQLIGRIVDATGYNRARINATATGLIIGRRLHPLINQGDAVFHIAHIRPTGGPYASTEPDLTIGGADAPDANADVSQRQGRTQPQSTSEESPPAEHRGEHSAPGNAQTEDAADGAAGREPAAAIDDEPLDAYSGTPPPAGESLS